MNRRDALTAIFGASAASVVESADVNVIPKEANGPLILVVSFSNPDVIVSEESAAAIRAKLGGVVPGIPVVVLVPGMRLEAIYKNPPAKIHERLGEWETTKWYDPSLGDWVVSDRKRIS